jgi:hypothetical protein
MGWITLSNPPSEMARSATERYVPRSSRQAVLNIPWAAAAPLRDPQRGVISGAHMCPVSLWVQGRHGLGTGKSIA